VTRSLHAKKNSFEAKQKPQVSHLVRTTRFRNNLHQGHSKSKDCKAK